MNIWFTSDTHFGHVNIVRGVSTWLDRITQGREATKADIESFHNQTRDFKTVEDMNQTLIENINANVKENDILWHLGDWALGSQENVTRFRNSLRCQNVNLVLGNHDQHIAKKEELQMLFSSVHTAFGWPSYGNKAKIGGERFLLCHFPMLIWDKHHHGTIHLHGHSHGSLKNPDYYKRKVMDVGIDTHPEFRPYHIDEIYRIMNRKNISVLDGHKEKHKNKR